MQDGKRQTPFAPNSRRAFFGAALGLGAGLGAPASLAQAGAAKRPISWVHGVSATLVDAHGLENDRIEGNARIVRGRSWSNVPLYFAVPSPGLDQGTPLKIAAIWVRHKAARGASISAMTLHDCERTLVHMEKLAIRQDDWADTRLALDQPCFAARTLGVTLTCDFADVERQIAVSAVGCEFTMVV